MKNYFLILAFMLISSFTFANTDAKEIKRKVLANKTEISENKTAKEEDSYCMNVTLSCGIGFQICNFNGNILQLINAVLLLDDLLCGDSNQQ